MKTIKQSIPQQANSSTLQTLELINISLTILILLLFLSTGLGKVIYHKVFTIQMAKQPLPYWSKPILVYLLPFIELSISLLVVFVRTRLLGFILSSILLIAYTVYAYLAYIEIYGYVICACGKIFQGMNWRDHFYLNALLSLISISGIYTTLKLKQSEKAHNMYHNKSLQK